MAALERVPGKVVAVHVSYRSRAAERGTMPPWPSYFLKPSSSLAQSGDPIARPPGCELLAFEGEVASHQVLRICDILGALGLQSRIERGPGRHGVSSAFYVYLRAPDGRPQPLAPEQQPAEVTVGAGGFTR